VFYPETNISPENRKGFVEIVLEETGKDLSEIEKGALAELFVQVLNDTTPERMQRRIQHQIHLRWPQP